MRSLKSDQTTSQDLSSGALDHTTSISKPCKLEQILFKASVSITETITITLDSAAGTTYDTVLRSVELSAESSYVWRPEGEMNLQEGDEIKVECTNANLTGTIYVVIKISEIG